MPVAVFITGASSGIGAALAQQYARRGARVGLVGRNAEKLKAVAAALDTESAIYIAAVTDLAAMQDAARDFISRFGLPDIVIANAGISGGTQTEQAADYEVFREIMDTNVAGMVATFQPFVAALREAGKGTLVGIASMAGVRGLPGSAAYSASKAAAMSYLESLRIELRGSGVAVVTIAPGYIDTPMTSGNRYPMPFLMPVEVAAEKFVAAIDKRRSFAVFPWQMAWTASCYRMLPNFIYDRLFARAPRKARRSQI
jgi:short-subunit dehydrogenase